MESKIDRRYVLQEFNKDWEDCAIMWYEECVNKEQEVSSLKEEKQKWFNKWNERNSDYSCLLTKFENLQKENEELKKEDEDHLNILKELTETEDALNNLNELHNKLIEYLNLKQKLRCAECDYDGCDEEYAKKCQQDYEENVRSNA